MPPAPLRYYHPWATSGHGEVMRAIVGRRDDREVRGSVHVEAGVARRHFLNHGQTGFTTIQAHAHRSGGIDRLGWAGIGDTDPLQSDQKSDIIAGAGNTGNPHRRTEYDRGAHAYYRD
ncbi:hypothetical protein NJB1907f44_23860 [Mycobacterium marinum]|nr:hypothetical protein MMRN_36220 [Mycobacterium marinum]GJN96573.1 hypothetical protein NJB1907f34b_04460 [Mycobacterium marinum]GJO05158.1 hypothetical protein NJB1808e29_32460 [Mycobacterium marinum]GJO12435.1 hypothetical protein NJB1907E90_34180 [Mycobacterium marinum]GJO28226.1 hypothetical protein NJB1907E11_45700 [Mycobacterium marinum]